MRRITLLCLLLFGVTSASSVTLSDLIAQLRSRVGETDTATSSFTDTDAEYWLNEAQDKINEMGSIYEKSYDVTWTLSDSLGEFLPSEFVREKGVMLWVSPMWLPVIPNPYWMALPSNSPNNADPQYFIDWVNTDSAKIYCKNITQERARVRVFYVANPADMDSLLATCYITERLQTFIIEEAFSFYLQSLMRHAEAKSMQMGVRQDMGIAKQSEITK